MLDTESRAVLEDELRLRLSKAATYHVQEKYYIPRLLLSAAVFLVVYLFCSLVIRDPIPMVDELIIAFASAASVWALALRREAKNSFSQRLQGKVKSAVKEAEEEPSLDAENIEAFVYDTEKAHGKEELARILSSGNLPTLEFEVTEEARGLLSSFVGSDRNGLSKLLKQMSRNSKRNARLEDKLVVLAMKGNVDLAFVLFLAEARIT